MFIIRYIKQSDIDWAEKWLDRRLTATEIEAKKSEVKVESERGAERLVDHLRETGHIAAYYTEEELRG